MKWREKLSNNLEQDLINMTLWTKKELIEALSDEILEYKISDNLEIDEVLIDSRKITKNGLFIAIRGENNDGHKFLNNAFANGCVLAITEESQKQNFIKVKDSFKALYKLAAFSRNRSKAKIIAITGSVGKTSTKELLKLALENYGKTFATIGNLNNHFGVPLSLCNFAKDCDFGIFEMGMNHLNEISPLSKLAKPHLAIITNVAPVHIEFFKNEQEIALAKSEIFDGLVKDGIVLINRDNQHFDFLQKQAKSLNINNIFSFGENLESDFCLKEFVTNNFLQSEILLKYKEQEIKYQISTSNKANIFNSIIAVGTLILLLKKIEINLENLKNFNEKAGRGEILEANCNHKKIVIIDDSYNASLPSIISGIDYAISLKKSLNKKRVVILLGDMLELGEKSVALHEEVSKKLSQNIANEINFIIFVGIEMSKISNKLHFDSYKTFLNSELASCEIEDILEDGDILYVKGSRGMKLEKIINKLK